MKTSLPHFPLTAAPPWRRLACLATLALGLGGFASLGQAQTILPVGGDGAIGDSVLTTVSEGSNRVAKLPNDGVYWTADGGEGIVYSHLTSPTLTVAATGPVTLKFSHRYFFEAGFDGGAVYVSVNGAEPAYVEPGAFTTNGYDNAVTGSNVFTGGEQVFNGQSTDYGFLAMIESVVALGSLNAGDTVAIEFRGGWDDAYTEASPNWEISTVQVTGTSGSLLNVDFFNGRSGFTVASDPGLSGPWSYPGQRSVFEINADDLTADRYVADVPAASTIIDLNDADIEVVLLAGTLAKGDSFTLFNLSGGTTLRGDYGKITLPEGAWDLSQLGVTGIITCKAAGGGLLLRTFDTTQGALNLDPIANLMAIPPTATATVTADINYTTDVEFLGLPGITDGESFSILWEAWLDVSVDGPGDYTFGTASDDGSVIFLDLNDDGDFSDPGERIVSNNQDQATTVATGTVTLTTNSVHMVIGYYENGGGNTMTARFKKGTGLNWNELRPIHGRSGYFFPGPLTPVITGFSIDTHGDARIAGSTITLNVPFGTPVTALTPTITSTGVSISPASGVARDFTQPVTYTVTAADSSSKQYEVTVKVLELPVTEGLSLWLKADAINPHDATQCRIYGSDSFVAQWNDQSGIQDARQATAAAQPKYLGNDLNGLPTVRWNGAGQYLRGASYITIKTIFAVCKKDAEATTLDGLFCASPNQDNQNIRGNATVWNAITNGSSNSADFAHLGPIRVNGADSATHNSQWHILMEESTSAPLFTYQLGQMFNSRYFNGRVAEFITFERSLSPEEMDAVGSYLADKYALSTTYPATTPQATMYAFGIPRWPGVIDQTAKTIALTVPYSTDLTALAPTFTLSAGASCNRTSGSPLNFSSPVIYTVKSSDNAITRSYLVTVVKAPVETGNQILEFGPGGIITGTDIAWTVSYAADVTSLAPSYVIPLLATGSPASGAVVDFTAPVHYTINAEDGSTQEYTVTVTVPPAPPTTRVPALWLDASQIDDLSDGQVLNQWQDRSGLGNHANRTDGSPVYKPGIINGKPVVRFDSGSFLFNRISTIRSVFWVVKENLGATQPRFLLGDQAAYHFHRGAANNGPLWDGNASANIRSGTTRLMGTAIDGTATSLPAETFQLISVVTTGNVQANTVSSDRNTPARSWNGDIAEILIYDQPLTSLEEAEIGSYLTAKYGLATTYPAAKPLANIYSVALLGKTVSVDQATKSVVLEVPYGTDVSAIATSFVTSGGATCDRVSGAIQNFNSPLTLTVKSSDSLITNTYTVTVKIAPKPPSATLPVLWLDASKLTGLSDGQQVDSWLDASGLSNHANRANGAPVYKTGVINGKPVLRFDSGSFNFSRISTIRSVFWVLKENLGATHERFLLGDTSSYHFHRAAGVNGPLWSAQYVNPNISNGKTKMMGVQIDGTTTSLPGGVFQLISLVTTGNVEANNITDDRNIPNRSWNGDIAEILIYDKALSTAEEAVVNGYLAVKYGLNIDYGTWSSAYPGFNVSNRAGDADKDGLTNQQEYAFGLNPTLGSSVNPISVPLDKQGGTVSYTRRNPALTGLAYTVWTSTNLVDWTQDTVATAGQTVTATSGDVQTVKATLAAQPVNGRLFVRVKAQ